MNILGNRPRQPQITEMNASTRIMTNHQALKDRELQRAYEKGSDYALMPTRSRLRRMRLSLEQYNTHEMAKG